jgi:hypothetical protein
VAWQLWAAKKALPVDQSFASVEGDSPNPLRKLAIAILNQDAVVPSSITVLLPWRNADAEVGLHSDSGLNPATVQVQAYESCR